MVVSHDALQDAQHLANAATIVTTASPHVCFTLCIINMHELKESYRGCNVAVVAAHNLLPAPSWIWTRPRRRMLARHRAVAKEYTTDALKIQQQMEDLIAERDIKASPAVPTKLCRETTV